jgi:manganese-dependent inorganic pyrophosphatase
VRLGDLNAQTRWVLDRSGAPEPELLEHVLLRVGDVMLEGFPTVSHREPIRQVGLMMARQDLELIPIVDDEGALAGVMTERTLARRYIRESRDVTSLADAAATVEAIVAQLDGELVSGDPGCELAGRVWVLAMDLGRCRTRSARATWSSSANRDDAQRRAIELGVSLLVTSNGTRPTDEVLGSRRSAARRSSPRRGTATCRAAWSRCRRRAAP